MEGRGGAAESEEEVEGVLLSDILSSEYRPFHLRGVGTLHEPDHRTVGTLAL